MTNVFFTASKYLKKEKQDVYDVITTHLAKRNLTVLSLETQNYDELLGKNSKNLELSRKHYKYILNAIKKSSLGILEVSHDTFRLGHEATLLLLFNKPVLCLSAYRDFSKDIHHQLFYAHQYDKLSDIPILIDNFIDRHKDKLLSVRFNSFISPKQKSFLQREKQKTGLSLSKIIRDLIDKEIQSR